MQYQHILHQSHKNKTCTSDQEPIHRLQIRKFWQRPASSRYDQNSREEAGDGDGHSGWVGRRGNPEVDPSHDDQEGSREVDVPHIIPKSSSKMKFNS